ncbi:hypothetical protein GX411_09150 [Candidatus Fermentibacteria bacterium]|nr:hypothetical protein [Candidatus Fermentibacteria bacterium]
MDNLVPIAAIVLSIGGPLAIALVVILLQHRQQAMLNQMVSSAVAAGRSPDEVREIIEAVKGRPSGSSGRRSLRTGIILAAVGLGLAFIALVTGTPAALGAAGFMILLGLAFVAIWFLVDKPKNQS